VSLLAIACLGAVLACTAELSEAPAVAATLNAKCPMMGEGVTPEGGTVDFRGQTIGFCCDGCGAKFEKLTDEKKLAALEKHGTTLPQ
jgi:hypothetical protein